MSKMVIVQFKKPWRGYGPDEKAGFEAEQAEKLVAGGFAELVNRKAPTGAKGGQAKKSEQQPSGAQAGDQKAGEEGLPPDAGDQTGGQNPEDDDRKP